MHSPIGEYFGSAACEKIAGLTDELLTTSKDTCSMKALAVNPCAGYGIKR